MKKSTLYEVVRILLTLIFKHIERGVAQAAITPHLLFDDMSSRFIGRCANCSHQSVGRVARKLLATGTPLLEVKSMDSAQLFALLYPHSSTRRSYKRRPPYTLIESELTKRPSKYRKKLNLLYEAYYAENPDTALGVSQFYSLVRQHLKQSKFEHRFHYEPGEILFCDYAGIKLKYFDDTGQLLLAYLFVAVLGHSKKMFAFATPRITAVDWIDGLVEALHYFGGVPHIIHFDNGQLVNKAGAIATLNDHVTPFKQFYNAICDTSSVGSPKHNSNAEKSVQYIQNRVSVPLREQHIVGLEKLNQVIRTEVEKLNDIEIQGRGLSRNQRFESTEKHALKALPTYKYRPFLRSFKQKISARGTVKFNHHEYSVPYKTRNQDCVVYVRSNSLEVAFNSTVVATHTLSQTKGGQTILAAHKHPIAAALDKQNQKFFGEWAASVGVNTQAIIDFFYERAGSPHSKRAGKESALLKKLARIHSPEQLEKACEYARKQRLCEVEDIRMFLASAIYEDVVEEPDILPMVAHHKNIRGEAYYKGLMS